MPDREKVINELVEHIESALDVDSDFVYCVRTDLLQYTVALLKEQEDRHRLEVHNIGNVDIPEGVSKEHFHLVMNNVVEALQHTDKGESYPYEESYRQVTGKLTDRR